MSALRTYLPAGIVSVLFLYLRTFHLPGVPFAVSGDETLFFSRALRLLHGQVLYRDVFELVTPGTELVYAFGFRLFGVHGWVIEGWHVFLGAALCMVITSIARQLLSGALVLLPMLLFLVFDLNSAMDATHHWWSTLCALVATSVLMRGRGPWKLAACGGFCALATLFTQTQGGLLFIAISIFLAIEAGKTIEELRKRALFFVLPYLALCSAVLGYYCVRAGTSPLLTDLLIFPLTGLSGPINSPKTYLHQWPPLHGVVDLFRLIPFVIVLGLVPYVYLFSLYSLWRGRVKVEADQRIHLLLLNLVGLALFAAIASGPRFFRICTVAPPALLVFCTFLQQKEQVNCIVRYGVWSIAAVFMVCLPLRRQVQWHRTLSLPTGQVAFADPGQWQEYQWLQQRTSPGDMMFNQSDAILYLGLHNPVHVEFVNNDDFTSAADIKKILARMQSDAPRYVVLEPDMPSTSHDHSGPFRGYIHEHYCIAQVFRIGPEQIRQEVWGRCRE